MPKKKPRPAEKWFRVKLECPTCKAQSVHEVSVPAKAKPTAPVMLKPDCPTCGKTMYTHTTMEQVKQKARQLAESN